MNDILDIAQSSFFHMIRVPYFWHSMGATTALSMFVGPLFFNGNLKASTKALMAKLIFALMLFLLAVSQIIDAAKNRPDLVTPNIRPVTYVVAFNVLAVTFFWILGFFLGVFIIWLKNKRKYSKMV